MKTLALLTLVCLVTACPHKPKATPDSGPATLPLLVVKNECAETIWIQQQGLTSANGSIKVESRKSITYDIPVAGLASTRFWSKTGCDATGEYCTTGQSSPPCPAAGCTPPVDSMIEATWGCDLPEAQCGTTPQGKTLKGPTWWNSSAVGGFTLPYTIEVGKDGGTGCSPVNCNELSLTQCPTAEDLSNGGLYPDLKAVDLRVYGPKPAGGTAPVIGCYSPCQALTQVGYGGKGYQPPSDPHALPFCCPTPPESPAACSAGPVVKTKYVQGVHGMCHGTTYAYAYDDGQGLRTCTPTTKLTMTFCPPQPAGK